MNEQGRRMYVNVLGCLTFFCYLAVIDYTQNQYQKLVRSHFLLLLEIAGLIPPVAYKTLSNSISVATQIVFKPDHITH